MTPYETGCHRQQLGVARHIGRTRLLQRCEMFGLEGRELALGGLSQPDTHARRQRTSIGNHTAQRIANSPLISLTAVPVVGC